MNLDAFHFAQPLWLWGLLVIPAVWAVFSFFCSSQYSYKHLESMIDSHLLPYLLINRVKGKVSSWKNKLLIWSVIWGCLMMALAGPRWSFRDIEMMSKDQSLVILLDLSKSMEATDIKPSRLVRAKQKIEDLIQGTNGVKIGLIAFAADPHMIAPLTEDKETLRHLLPSIGTDLVYVQGSRLSSALKMASGMLEAESGHRQTLVIVSDGGFEDSSAIADVKKLAKNGISVHTIGIGTVEGAVLQDSKGVAVKKNGTAVLSKLERGLLQEISKAGQGYYVESRYSSHDESAILEQLQSNAETISAGRQIRFWDEGFLYVLLPVVPLFLYWFRKGMVLGVIAWPMMFFSMPLSAGNIQEYFMNSEEVGAAAFEQEDYQEAFQAFQDPYRKGGACYKGGQFPEAEKMFKQSIRQEVACSACYNLGNALAQQKKFQEAITAYEEVLKKWPEHQSAKENLELIKKMVEQQKEQSQQQKDQKQNQQDNPQNNDHQNQQDNQQESDHQDQQNSDSQEQKDNRQESDDEGSEGESSQDQEEKDDSLDSEEQSQQGDEDANRPDEQASSQDEDADVWLNRLSSDPKALLRNKFYIESKKNGTQEGIDPW